MIKNIKIYQLRNNEFIQFIKDTLQLFDANQTIKEKVKERLEALINVFNLILSNFKENKSNTITDELVEIDNKRDEALNGISRLLEAYTHHYHADKRDNARLLLESIKIHGTGLTRLNYMAETSVIDSLISKWYSDNKMTEALDKMNLKEWAEELSTENTLFNQKYLDRNQQEANAPAIRLGESRKSTTELYHQLIEHTNAHILLNDDEVFNNFTNEINRLIDQYNKIIEMRSKSSS
nr:DUF6261 family protein [uncultured Carboxylicivirga sp.]